MKETEQKLTGQECVREKEKKRQSFFQGMRGKFKDEYWVKI